MSRGCETFFRYATISTRIRQSRSAPLLLGPGQPPVRLNVSFLVRGTDYEGTDREVPRNQPGISFNPQRRRPERGRVDLDD